MPQLGETVAEGKITSWYKSVGDSIAPGDNLFEIETDKTSMEVPSTVSGVLSEIRTLAGATVPVGSIVALISESGSAMTAPAAAPAAAPAIAPAIPKAGASSAPAAASAARPAPAAPEAARPLDPFNAVRTPERQFGPATLANGTKVTPVARRLASEASVDLASVSGSGPNGRIVAKDIASGAARTSGPQVQPAVPAVAAPASVASAAPTKIALDGMRRTIAKRLVESKQTVPHFYLSVDVEMDRVASVRTEINASAAGRFKLSVNDFIIKALGLALQQVPEANATWGEDSILRFTQSDVGVAVSVEGGLFTPVIRSVESKSLSVISREMKSLAERARSKSLKPAEYQGGTISISNLGMFGVSSFSAIINPPQSAILAVGAVRRQPFEVPGGSFRFGSVMSVTLSCDHRVIDGALGAQLLAAFRGLLEAPLLLFA